MTITDPGELRRRLADVRRQGFVLCPGFLHVDATGIAVPVRDETGHVAAAVSVIVPNDEHARGYVPVLTAGGPADRAPAHPRETHVSGFRAYRHENRAHGTASH